ncbi:phenylacetate--CoA ligase family protein [Streptomyces sp. RY43-2]|uniref:Phenylacetate--CoA ligase family protein n=1 Tax=Streptomyces macrolidinus TaxID=2952607 RepID=A0ABT0ZM08_9ACTN|nr:phenylacetate--CoA ligase family protein [Streptomyces macrolidinus]MCN9244627.1 phenylacetate--CoA ligase family protein [Streptomyces macrolidinus]
MGTVTEHTLDRLGAQLEYALSRSPYYRRAWRAHRASALAGLGDLADLRALPFTTTDQIDAAGPLGLSAVDRTRIARYAESRDTRGRTLGAAATATDLGRASAAMEEALRAHVRPDDLAFVAVPYELSGGAHDMDRALSALGTGVVGVGALSAVCPPARTVALMARTHPSVFVATPDRAARTHHELALAGHDPRTVGLRTLLHVGGACAPAKAAKTAALWGTSTVWAYGSTLTPAAGLPCVLGSVHLNDAQYLAEVVDPDGTDPVPDGRPGELVLTTLTAEATPLLRWRTGDLVRRTRCGCDDPRPSLEQHGRVEDRRRSPTGRTLTAVELEQAALTVPGTGLYCVTGTVDGQPTARIDATARLDATAPDVCHEVAAALRELSGVAWQVTAADRRTFLDATVRAGRRRLDLRDLEAG